jgi:TonB-dependent starch-binding outer membrane protein SusC
LSVQIMGVGSRSVYMPDVYRNNFNGSGNASVNALNAWTPETAGTAEYPRLSISNNSNNQQYSDFWFRDGSFIKLKTVELGANLPESLVKRIGISKTRIYLNGYNLLCFDHVKDFDPENTDAAIYRYPFQRIYTMGVNITF